MGVKGKSESTGRQEGDFDQTETKRERQGVMRGADGGVKGGMCDEGSDGDTGGALGAEEGGETGFLPMSKCSFRETSMFNINVAILFMCYIMHTA